MTKEKYSVVYYSTKNGDCFVQEFIDSRSKGEQAKILGWISALEEQGPLLPRPYADLLEEGIHELRITLKNNQIRMLYFFCFRSFIILTHAFYKNTARVPKSEIVKAKKYKEDFLTRYNKKLLKELNL